MKSAKSVTMPYLVEKSGVSHNSSVLVVKMIFRMLFWILIIVNDCTDYTILMILAHKPGLTYLTTLDLASSCLVAERFCINQQNLVIITVLVPFLLS